MSRDWSVSRVEPETLDAVWPEIEPLIEKSLKHGQSDGLTMAYLHEAVSNARMILWVVHDGLEIGGVVMFEVLMCPGRTKLFVVLIAGRDGRAWSGTVEQLLKKYRDMVGADVLEASCREGLARYLADRGWKRKAIVMEAP